MNPCHLDYTVTKKRMKLKKKTLSQIFLMKNLQYSNDLQTIEFTQACVLTVLKNTFANRYVINKLITQFLLKSANELFTNDSHRSIGVIFIKNIILKFMLTDRGWPLFSAPRTEENRRNVTISKIIRTHR